MSISVVITTYNRAALLEATLAQLRRQRFERDDEVIVVDNASSDGTPAVIARAGGGFPVRLIALREATPGKTPALNAGIAIARGDVLALTDDDVMVADDWIAAIRRRFADPATDLVGGRVDPLWERTPPAWLRFDDDGRFGPMASPLALLHYGEAQPLDGRTAVGANLVVRRRVHDAIGGFAPHLGRLRGTLLCGEDHDFCDRTAAAGYRCEYRPEIRVRHWVPCGRARLSYYLRWFYWSGVTNALLETPSSGGRRVPRYMVRQAVAAAAAALAHLARGRRDLAAAQVMEAAYAVGYIARHVGLRRGTGGAAPALAHKT